MTEICTLASNVLQTRNFIIGIITLCSMIIGLHIPGVNSLIISISRFAKQILIAIGSLVVIAFTIKGFCILG